MRAIHRSYTALITMIQKFVTLSPKPCNFPTAQHCEFLCFGSSFTKHLCHIQRVLALACVSIPPAVGDICGFRAMPATRPKSSSSSSSESPSKSPPKKAENVGLRWGRWVSGLYKGLATLQGTNISHLGRRILIFKSASAWDMLVSWRVNCVA